MKLLHYPQVDVKKWASYYGLRLNPCPCDKCGKLIDFTIPYLYKHWRGVYATPHECGPNYQASVMVDIKNRYIWRNIYQTLIESVEEE